MLAVIPAKNRIQENAVSKIVSLRQAQDQEQSLPDQDHDQNHIPLVWGRSCNKMMMMMIVDL